MPSIYWSSFFISSSVASTVVHFMPSSHNANAPYPAICKFEVYGVGFPKRALLVEGARLQQPDGLRIEDLIPDLKGNFTGLLGFNLELTVNQAHAKLSDSKCYVDLRVADDLVRFGLKPRPESCKLCHDVIIADETSNYSLVLINAGMQMQKISLGKLAGANYKLFPFGSAQDGAESVNVSPWSVIEVALSEQDLIDGIQHIKGRRLKLGQFCLELNSDLAAFLVCRDRHNKKLLNVRAL